ncbi:MAG: 16S rRNA processing protein RimM [Muribaculaceae bacterium]|nr:16S rRNA processing protein RimM [Muribaculaceae bacterium]
MILSDEIVTVGKFQKTHALKGELNMLSEVDPQYFLEGNPLIVDYDGIWVPYYVESIRPKGATSYLVKLSGIDTEEEASHFVNKEVHILQKDAEEWLEEEEEEMGLIGYTVVDKSSGQTIGIIEGIEDSTSNVLFIVRTPQEDEVFIPANEDLIQNIDDEKEIIELSIPEGLLDINSKNDEEVI